ncbi:DUF6090 family protein [uncultured Eudoraea sp.]|uniref:DUF6090 family protein n=1 Tax=uncultured Eudoraea sp. TaxID=1035614 RepID=UPI002617AAE0|nr:DUF6090 family protein [uncultured Eudoraea sp.]
MALFFKRIRHKLLNSKRFGKYTLYAIGEVLILIFGIAIAVQVNNWDQRRRNRTLEINILKSIKEDLHSDLNDLQFGIDLHTEGNASAEIILNHLENNLPYDDSLGYHFLAANYFTYLGYSRGGIESLRSLGVNTITNEKLRSQIITLYDMNYVHMLYLSDQSKNKNGYAIQNLFISRFDQGEYFDDPNTENPYDGSMIPLDYEALKKDTEYIYYVKTYRNGIDYYLNECYTTKTAITQLIKDIEEELNSLEQ